MGLNTTLAAAKAATIPNRDLWAWLPMMDGDVFPNHAQPCDKLEAHVGPRFRATLPCLAD